MLTHMEYPPAAIEDVVRIRRRIDRAGVPGKLTDTNLLVGTWNIRAFGAVYESWDENPGSPKRNLRAIACIAEVVRRLDVLAIQEVRRDASGVRLLADRFLGPDWGLILSDVTAGAQGNAERLAFVYDKRRVQLSGLAGEIVLPPTEEGQPAQQFARTPYIVGFRSGDQRFSLLTAHVLYGASPEERLPELEALARYTAAEIRDRVRMEGAEEKNLIVLGDFNIDERGDNPLFQAFVSAGLVVPPQLRDLKTTFSTEPKYYDHIAWFMGELDLNYNRRAGVVDFAGAVFQELSLHQMSYRLSDHLPLWVEFITDRSAERMAEVLGLDLMVPDPLSAVPE